MEKGKVVTIEILGMDSSRATWWNEFVGETFEAIEVSRTLFALTPKGCENLRQRAGQIETIFSAMIHVNFACIYGEVVERVGIPTFEIHPKNINYLMQVRVFRATEDFNRYDRTGTTILSTPLKKGDLFEEMFDKPNCLTKIEGEGERGSWNLHEINQMVLILPKFELENTIDVKESQYFETQKKKLAPAYKRTRNAIARANEKLNELRFLLNIEDNE